MNRFGVAHKIRAYRGPSLRDGASGNGVCPIQAWCCHAGFSMTACRAWCHEHYAGYQPMNHGAWVALALRGAPPWYAGYADPPQQQGPLKNDFTCEA